MPIERILVRTMIGLSILFFTATITFYPPHYSFVSGMFLMVLITADILLPKEPKRAEKKWEQVASKLLIGLIAVAAAGCAVCVFLLWKLGPYGRLGG